MRKFKLHLNRKRIKGTLHEDQYTFLIVFENNKGTLHGDQYTFLILSDNNNGTLHEDQYTFLILSDNNNGTLHEDQYTFCNHISLISSHNEKYFGKKGCRENENTFYAQ